MSYKTKEQSGRSIFCIFKAARFGCVIIVKKSFEHGEKFGLLKAGNSLNKIPIFHELARMKFLIVASLLVLSSIGPSAAFDDLLANGTHLYKLGKKLADLGSRVAMLKFMVARMNNPETEIGEVIGQMKEQVRNLPVYGDIYEAFAFIRPFTRKLPTHAQLHKWETDVESVARHIDAIFREFSIVCLDNQNAESWKTFAENHLDVGDKMQEMRLLLFSVPEDGPMFAGTLTTLVNKTALLRAEHCAEAAYVQTFLGRLFQAVILREIKGLMMVTYVTMVRYHEAAWSQVLSIELQRFRKRIEAYVEHFGLYMDRAPKDSTSCDPANGTWVRDKTYFEMEGFKQAVVQHYGSFGRSKDCDNAKTKGLLSSDVKDSCTGDLSDCGYFGWLEVCRMPQDNTKRYAWIKGGDAFYGNHSYQCPDDRLIKWSGLSNTFTSHCVCKCRQEESNFISLVPVTTTTSKNMVITGLRFVRKNQVLYIQAQEGKLLPNGFIDHTTQTWIPLPEKQSGLVLTAENNKFYLGDAMLAENYVAVGVSLKYDNGFSINLTGTKFIFSTGELLDDSYSVDAHNKNSEELVLPKVNSVNTNLTHTPDSHNHWVQLEMSDLKSDAGQSTVPLFDGVPVEAHAPVGGIGMVHKGVKNFAGFISPRVFTLNYRKFLANFEASNADGRRFGSSN